jgi:tetratricopeptide (TPR) repeat protein
VRSLTSDASQQSLAKRPTKNSDAYEAYLSGRYHWTKRDEADLRQAVDYFKKAITLDQDFSQAYAGLADSQTLLFNYNYDLRPEVIAEAKNNLHRALELKPDSADALTTLGAIQMVYDWDWKGAEESLKAAATAEPNLSIAHLRYGSLLARLGRIPEALLESERAVELDPLSIASITNLGLVYFCKKDFAAADIQFRKALDLGDTVSIRRGPVQPFFHPSNGRCGSRTCPAPGISPIHRSG